MRRQPDDDKSSSPNTNTKGGSIRVLVANANARESATVRSALRKATPSFSVSPARRLWSAAQILAGMPIDAVLLSLELSDPGQDRSQRQMADGLEAFFTLQKEADNIPVLILGGDPERARRAVEAGADGLLQPEDYTPETLSKRILAAIKQRQPERPPASAPAVEIAPETPALRVLLVEEDPLVRRLLHRNLERHRHKVHVVHTPQDALIWMKSAPAPVDLLVCDLHAAAMDGLRLSQHLRRSFPAMRTLVFLSGSRVPGAVRQDPDFIFSLPKPYALSDFEAVIAKIEHQHAQAGALAPQSFLQESDSSQRY